jgi:hypothetical protein
MRGQRAPGINATGAGVHSHATRGQARRRKSPRPNRPPMATPPAPLHPSDDWLPAKCARRRRTRASGRGDKRPTPSTAGALDRTVRDKRHCDRTNPPAARMPAKCARPARSPRTRALAPRSQQPRVIQRVHLRVRRRTVAQTGGRAFASCEHSCAVPWGSPRPCLHPCRCSRSAVRPGALHHVAANGAQVSGRMGGPRGGGPCLSSVSPGRGVAGPRGGLPAAAPRCEHAARRWRAPRRGRAPSALPGAPRARRGVPCGRVAASARPFARTRCDRANRRARPSPTPGVRLPVAVAC